MACFPSTESAVWPYFGSSSAVGFSRSFFGVSTHPPLWVCDQTVILAAQSGGGCIEAATQQRPCQQKETPSELLANKSVFSGLEATLNLANPFIFLLIQSRFGG